MADWVKPNGNKITTNDEKATIAYCESLGWQRDEKKPSKKASKKKKSDG